MYFFFETQEVSIITDAVIHKNSKVRFFMGLLFCSNTAENNAKDGEGEEGLLPNTKLAKNIPQQIFRSNLTRDFTQMKNGFADVQ